MTPQAILDHSLTFALAVLAAALLLTVYRVIRGPTLPDRIVALDMLVAIAIGLIAVIAVKTGFDLYVDIAIALALVGFLATVALARLVLLRGSAAPRQGAPPQAPVKARAPRRRKPKPAGRRAGR